MSAISIILDFLMRFLAAIGSFSIFLTTWYLMFPERYDKAETLLLEKIRHLRSFFDKRYVKEDIEDTVNWYNEDNLGFEIPFGVNISWEDGANPRLEDGDVVVCLDKSDNQPKNIAKATLQYTENAVLPESRPCMKEKINEGINYSLSLDILNQSDKKNARRILRREVIEELETNDDLDETFEKLEEIKSEGMLGPIIIREYDYLKDYFPPDDEIKEATEEFLDFVEKHAKRKRGEKIDLEFSMAGHFDVTIAYIGELPIDPDDYYLASKSNLQDGKTVYLLAANDKIEPAKKVSQKVREDPVAESVDEVEYTVPESGDRPEEDAYCAQFVSAALLNPRTASR